MLLVAIAFIPVVILMVIFVFAAKAEAKSKENNSMTLKKAYLYLVSVISLVIAVIGAIILINLGLKTWVFPKADQNYYSYPCPVSTSPDGKQIACDQVALDQQKKMDDENRSAQKQRDAAQALAMLIVATPVWYFHWRMARKEV